MVTSIPISDGDNFFRRPVEQRSFKLLLLVSWSWWSAAHETAAAWSHSGQRAEHWPATGAATRGRTPLYCRGSNHAGYLPHLQQAEIPFVHHSVSNFGLGWTDKSYTFYFCSLRQRQILKHRMWHLHNVQVLMYPTTPCPPLHDQVSVCGVYPGRGAACEACAGQCTAPAWPHQGGWWPGGAGVVCPALPPRSSFRSLDSRWLVR